MTSGSVNKKKGINFKQQGLYKAIYQKHLDLPKKDLPPLQKALYQLTSYPETTVIPQMNFPWKITFDTLYNNEFLIRVHSRALSIPSEHNTI